MSIYGEEAIDNLSLQKRFVSIFKSAKTTEETILSVLGHAPPIGLRGLRYRKSRSPRRMQKSDDILLEQCSGEAADPDGALGLGDILKPELLLPLMETLSLENVASHLPEGEWTPEEIMELLQSPPFRQQVDSFTYASIRAGHLFVALVLTWLNVSTLVFVGSQDWSNRSYSIWS
ncbi:uncharacterized protein LOC143541435 [Bidens hawaiensis]|uniref:uncharacterized protein LOC143541435 n=1 Tax=Bidens hawaiensis TaxID=980011 RepID=UPI00404A37F4